MLRSIKGHVTLKETMNNRANYPQNSINFCNFFSFNVIFATQTNKRIKNIAVGSAE